MQQILQLGVEGSETTLPTESRVFGQGDDTFNYVQGFAADGTMSVDFTGTKRNFSITWSQISETDFKILYAIYKLQLEGQFLNFIYTDADGSETETEVFMQPPTRGSVVVRDVYYYNACTITLAET